MALPAPLAGAVIANQLMRAWFLLDGAFSALPSEIEEAMCQVMAHLWLQRYQQQLKSPSPFQSGFLDFCLNRVASDPSLRSVDSFRSAYSAVVFKGLLATIQTLRMSNTLPAI
ncbi:hypothetical protein CLOM_g5603 [Closterium sp. NIES-68]|nr:hypothetical protein CLOM_g5603 [Closterium sp. NIES-68]